MRRIFKYEVPMGGITPLNIPRAARIVHTDIQSRRVCFWALVDDEMPLQIRRFTVIGTGWEVPLGAVYIGTGQSSDEYVWHIFEIVGGK